MARVALVAGATVAGAVVGYYVPVIGPMYGAQIGFALGTVAAALLFPSGEETQGPRLGDLRVADASYGVPIPHVYGTGRVAGNMIWTSGIQEESTEEDMSMSGGGPTTTSYRYYSSFAMGLCAGPLAAVRKIWLDTKLVYDVSAGNLGVVQQRIGDLDPRGLLDEGELEDRRDEITAELEQVQSAMTIYLGTDTQLPDPVLEAHEGVGEVPAHRGMAYLVFQDLPLDAYGNRIPSVSAEVLTTSTMAHPKATVIPGGGAFHTDRLVFDAARQHLWSYHEQTIHQVDALANTLTRSETIDTVTVGGGPIVAGIGLTLAVDQDSALYVPLGRSASTNRLARIDPISLNVTDVNLDLATNLPEDLGAIATIRTSPLYVWATTYGTYHHAYCFLRPGAILPTGQPVPDMRQIGFYALSGEVSGLQGMMIAIDRQETAWIVCSSPVMAFDARTVLLHMDAFGTAELYDITASLQGGTLVTYDSQTHALLVGGRADVMTGGTRVVRFDCTTRTVVAQEDNSIAMGSVVSAWNRGIVGRQLWFASGFDSLQALDVDSLTVTRHATNDDWPAPHAIYGSVYDAGTHALWVAEAEVGLAKYYLDRLETAEVTLASIVQDLSQRAGLAPALVDTSALTPLVHGYVVSQRGEARAALEPVLGAFMADGIETDWGLRFGLRALTPVAALTPADLAAHEPEQTVPDVLTPERLDDRQLPMRVDVTYADPARDYQDTVQHARRFQAGQRARSERSLRLPVILTAPQAKQLAEQSLSEAWVGRTGYTLRLAYGHTPLDPGDVITVEALGQTHLMRLTQVQYGANGLIEARAVAYDTTIYTPSPSLGATSAVVPRAQTIQPVMPTGLFLLDTALLRDVDSGPGYYLAVTPQGSGAWNGAVVFSSAEGATWRSEATLTQGVRYGSSLTALAAGSPYVIDTGHTVDIRLARGSLSSISVAELLNGANAGLLGDEVLQWQTATALDATSWRLSTLLRGRRGTEWAMPLHRAGERFLVLTPQTVWRADMNLSEVGMARQYRAVTLNTDASTTTAQAFVNTARGLKPYSVEHVHGTRNASNDLTITWVRRTRLGGLWVDGRDVPLSEASEAYEVDVLAGATVVRTLTTTTPSVDYPASQQTTDGLTPGDPVTVTIYQLGQLGRGWPTTATV